MEEDQMMNKQIHQINCANNNLKEQDDDVKTINDKK